MQKKLETKERWRFLHIGSPNMFLLSFEKMLREHFNINEHRFLSRSGNHSLHSKSKDYWEICQGLSWLTSFFRRVYSAERIFLHSLFDPFVVILLFFQPWLIRKITWVLWGGDLYFYSLREKKLKNAILEFFRKFLIKKIPLITTTVPGDFALAKKWYNAKGKFIFNLMYESHTSRHYVSSCDNLSREEFYVVQVGNSACSSNNHAEILNRLSKLKKQNFRIVVPLSYGESSEKNYVETIVKLGNEKFGERFHALTEFMTYEEYNKHLATIDIAIFNHPRQQAMGNIIALLSLGKKVYIRSDITPWTFFRSLNFEVFDTLTELEILPLSDCVKDMNCCIAQTFFCKEKLIACWQNVFLS